ncbi:MAG: phage tail protein [Kofleriaceae bacterium]
MANAPSFSAGKFLMDLDGMRCGFLQSFEGGNMVAELASHKMGPSNFEKKHVTTTKWGAVKFKAGIGMSKAVYEWMQAAFDMGVLYKNGAITVADFNYKAQRRMDMMNMLMTKVTMPAFDGDSKESAYFDIEVMPEQIRWMKESGGDLRGDIGPKQKAFQCANFRFELGGLPCGRVNKIEGLAWECKTTTDAVGEKREHTIHPTSTSVSDFTLHISMADLEPWAAKAKSWFIDGNCLEGDEMSGAVVMLGPDMKTELGRIDLMNVGMKEFIGNPKLEAQSDKVARFQVKCYAERVKLSLSGTDA